MDMTEMHNAYIRATQEQPATENIDIDQETIKRWLETKNTTLWSDWSIDDEKGREKASSWLYKEIESLVQFTLAQQMVVPK